MTVRTEILTSFYQDSVVLMRVASQVRKRPGVREVAAFMGTPSNHALLAQSGLGTPENQAATPEDLILTVDAEDEDTAEAALHGARTLLLERRRETAETSEHVPRTLDSALRVLPNANLASISVPAAFAPYEAMRALHRNLNVFLFTDNVPLEDEIRLKKEALARGLLCMGPDCGTAYINGTGLGFFNVVPRGRVGCVAASGTGLQAVASRLAALGEGISHGIGVGGRDLSREVGGMMALAAIEALAADPGTEAIVVISKPPHPEVMAKLESALVKLEKPVVVCSLGEPSAPNDGLTRVHSLVDAADAAVMRLGGDEWSHVPFRDPEATRARLRAIPRLDEYRDRGILGLYTGGTLAYEARQILEPLLGEVAFNGDFRDASAHHRVVDLGDDAFTMGRPHPMIAPETRTEIVSEIVAGSNVGVLMLDLVLGRGAHHDPALPVAEALKAIPAKSRKGAARPIVLASVVGTPEDPQGLDRQVNQLTEAGVCVLPSNAEAARFAALLVKPELAPQFLESNR